MAFPVTQEIVMKNAIKTQRPLAKLVMSASLFALGLTAIGGTALAQQPVAAQAPADPVNSRSLANWPLAHTVRYSDLDVSTMKGAKTLYLRIRSAAEVLCESAATWGRKEGQVCVNKAVDDAVVRINRPLLSRYHQLRTQGDKAGLMQLAKVN
jgi:UrcA family protein